MWEDPLNDVNEDVVSVIGSAARSSSMTSPGLVIGPWRLEYFPVRRQRFKFITK